MAEEEQRERAEWLFLLATIALLGYLSFLLFRPFLEWVILGFLFAYLFRHPYEQTLRLVRKRGLAASIWLIVIFALFAMPFVVATVFLWRDVTGFAEALQITDWNRALVGVMEAAAGWFGMQPDPQQLESASRSIVESLVENVSAFFASFATNLVELSVRLAIGLFLFGFTVFYGFVDGARFREAILAAIPLHRPEKELLLRELQVVTDAVFVGHVLVALIQAILGTIGFFVLGVPRAFLWGFVMLIAALIPVIGPFVVWVPLGLYLLVAPIPIDGLVTDSHSMAGILILLVVGPIVSTIDNVLRPKLVGSRADIHPLVVLIGALGGLYVLGFTGFVVGPLVLAMFIVVLRVYRAHWRGEEVHTPGTTVDEARRQIGRLAPMKKPRPRSKRAA